MTATVTSAPKLTPARAAKLYETARLAGLAAGDAAKPVPMVVGTPTHPLGSNIDPTRGPVYVVEGGVCGFAGVKIHPARGPLVTYLRKRGIGYKGYYGGWYVPVHAFGQSLERKTAAAGAMARVFREAGIECYVDSRMD